MSQPRPYKVSALGGGTRHFVSLTNAVRFAAKQAHASWAQEDWSVWDTRSNLCVRMVAADGLAWDPFAPVTYVSL